MGLFGSARQRDQSLANPQQYQPMFSPDIAQQQSIAPQIGMPQGLDPAMVRQPKPSVFGHGGMGWDIVGAIGDGLSQMGGYGSPYANARQRQQQQAHEEAQWTRRQASELQQRQSMYDYEQQHKVPAPNDTERDYAMLERLYGPDQAKIMYRQRYNAPHYYVDQATGQPMMVGGPMPGGQDDGVDELPPGFTVKVGGAGSSAPRTFR